MSSDVRAPVLAPPVAAPFRDGRRGAVLRAAIITGLIVTVVLVAPLVVLPGLQLCAFRLWTGLPCPGCGMTRALHRLTQGDIAASFGFHPLAVVLAAGACAMLAGAVAGVATGHDPVWRVFERRATVIVAAFVASLVAVWILRTWIVPSWGPDGAPAPFSVSGAR